MKIFFYSPLFCPGGYLFVGSLIILSGFRSMPSFFTTKFDSAIFSILFIASCLSFGFFESTSGMSSLISPYKTFRLAWYSCLRFLFLCFCCILWSASIVFYHKFMSYE